MCYGLFVSHLGGESEVLPIGAKHQDWCGCSDRVHPRGFILDRLASEQLLLALRLCERVSRLQLGRDVLLPLLGGPLSALRLLLGAGGLATSLTCVLSGRWLPVPGKHGYSLPYLPVGEEAALGIAVFAYLLLVLALLWPGEPARRKHKARVGCFEVKLIDRRSTTVHWDSAGLAFFCAIATAWPKRRPWTEFLGQNSRQYALSAALLATGVLKGVGGWADKLRALELVGWRGKLICAVEDLPEIGRLHQARFGQGLRPSPVLKAAIERVWTGWGFEVLACPHVWALSSYLSPWRWRYLAVRCLALLLPMLALLLPRPQPPRLELLSGRLSCAQTEMGVCAYELQSAKVDQLLLRLEDAGTAGELHVEVSASAQALLASLGAEPVRSLRFRTAGQREFYLQMPGEAPGGVVVAAVGLNRAGRVGVAWVWYRMAGGDEAFDRGGGK